MNWTLSTLQVENTDKQLIHCCFLDISSPDFGITKNAFGLSSDYRKLMAIYSTKIIEIWRILKQKCWKEHWVIFGNKNYWNRKLSKLLNNWKNMWNLQYYCTFLVGWMASSYHLFFLLFFPTSTLVNQTSNKIYCWLFFLEVLILCTVARRLKTNNGGLLS